MAVVQARRVGTLADRAASRGCVPITGAAADRAAPRTATASAATAPAATAHVEVWLRPACSAPLRLRRVVRSVCATAGTPSGLADDAALLAGELVATSIRQQGGPVVATVQASDQHVSIDVRDRGSGSPLAATSPAVQRAWALVRRLADSWGCHLDADGRRMWVTVHHPPVASPGGEPNAAHHSEM